MPDSRRYWATYRGEDLGNALSERVNAYLASPAIGSRNALLNKAFSHYYSIDEATGLHAGTRVIRGGEQGELARVRVNHARALAKTLFNLVTSQRFTWAPQATNVDSKSIKEVRLAKSLLEFYWKQLAVEATVLKTVEHGVGPGGGEGFTHVTWDPFGGDEYLPGTDEDATKLMSGDVDVTFVPSWDVVRDATVNSWKESPWVIVRRWWNKYEAAARFAPPENPVDNSLRDKILDAPKTSQWDTLGSRLDTDQVEIFYFYHKRCAAIPDGREVMFLADGTLLKNPHGLELSKWPLQRFACGEVDGTPFPYSPFLEILGIQDVLDSLNTIAASNQTAFGAQIIAVLQGSQISPYDLSSGIRLLELPSAEFEPKAVQLTKTAPELFSFAASLQQQQELLMGLNNVVRGQPQSGEQSGSALALLQAQALNNSSDIQNANRQFVEELGQCVFESLQKYLSAPRQIAIVGQTNKQLVESFEMRAGALPRVRRIQISLDSPMSQSPQLRLEQANTLLQMGLVKTPEQYQTVVDTGRLESFTRSLSEEMLLIASENEQMESGVVPPVLHFDYHELHVREHRVGLASTLARGDANLIQIITAHIAEHERQWLTLPPQTAALTGQTSGMQAAMPVPEGGTPADVQGEMPSQPPGNPTAGQLPDLPINPSTGLPWTPEGGGR